ncbi:phage antirepressor KilAC domain-containing protein [Pseudomonas chlororaphis]|uniref:phage antirepressor KilAC domain-containing protein n=1 Tax=Pseudomonas chlororaphis TaxID=587753 RepID=UPI000F5885FD|nr:phage antirepressor KilAC domain-containing protein [Pseudomonas chlororaphis]AZC49674.1 DNA-binding protein Roi-related protein [Pseudomonas chlororaphis subsp. piscium]MBP5058526.1 phage antirepressor KilAC domain-containing protein [Pseudomonas chlororaphis]MBP5139256.1 phage antirepressor KilAC domain-containing protein [Pseudomonas chlororaphis]QTT98671.1 phage antirepressor KilAC domain-containing protein [Pseudomonas chlororaphis]
MERDLAKTAKYFNLTRPALIKLMREKGLINEKNLPTYPSRDREYLRAKDGQWWHPELGMQYSQSTRVKQAGLPWLAEQLGLEMPAIPADRRDVA